MFLESLLLFILFLILISLSVRKRVNNRRYRSNPFEKISEPRSSYLSDGLLNLIGTAGGIYLALITTLNFLQLNYPNKIMFFGLTVEPIAGVSFLIAIIQPYVLSIIGRFKWE